ncbi:unnamed protein product [Ectocarpus sp. 8 AP-2014]
MFALRSSPSSLVCDIRDGWAATSTAVLSAPRPRRASVRLIYPHYDSPPAASADDRAAAGGDDYGSVSSGGRSAFSPAVSDYAGVFEAGFDPAQVRASMSKEVVEVGQAGAPAAAMAAEEAAALVVEERRAFAAGGGGARDCREWRDGDDGAGISRGQHAAARSSAAALAAGGGVAREEEDSSSCCEEEEDFLFDMEGLKDATIEDQLEDNNNSNRRDSSGSSSMRAAAAAAAADYYGYSRGGGWGTTTAAAAAAVPVEVKGRNGGASCRGVVPQQQEGTTARTAAGRGLSPAAAAGGGATREVSYAGFKGAALLRTPRVIAPRGTRCVTGGMYRLRLSTSC